MSGSAWPPARDKQVTLYQIKESKPHLFSKKPAWLQCDYSLNLALSLHYIFHICIYIFLFKQSASLLPLMMQQNQFFFESRHNYIVIQYYGIQYSFVFSFINFVGLIVLWQYKNVLVYVTCKPWIPFHAWYFSVVHSLISNWRVHDWGKQCGSWSAKSPPPPPHPPNRLQGWTGEEGIVSWTMTSWVLCKSYTNVPQG